MRRFIRCAGLLPLLSLGACDLVDLTTVVEWPTFSPTEAHIAVSFDGDFIWVDQEIPNGRQLLALNPDDGEVVDNIGNLTGDFAILDLAPVYDVGHFDEVWVLHANGFRTRWSVEDNLTAFQFPIPASEFPNIVGGQYCAMATGLDGSQYIIASEIIEGFENFFLFRHKDGVFTKSAEPFSTHVCPDVAYDLPLDEVAVLSANFPGVWDGFWFDGQTLDETYTYLYDPVANPMRDFAAFNHNVALIFPAAIRTFDNMGDPFDTVWDVDAYDLDTQYVDNSIRLWWAGWHDPPGGPTHVAGWYRLQKP